MTLAGPFTVTDDKATVTCPARRRAWRLARRMTCTASYTITQADLDAGSVTNTATATPTGTVTRTRTTETVTAVQSRALTLVKTATPATYDAVGDVISYSYVVNEHRQRDAGGPGDGERRQGDGDLPGGRPGARCVASPARPATRSRRPTWTAAR